MIKDLSLYNVLLVGCGGFTGSILRYVIGITVGYSGGFPVGTFLVNVLGSFLIGVLFSLSGKIGQEWSLVLTTGFCGGFTTFSTFSYENSQMFQHGDWQHLIAYILGSLLFGLGACAVGSNLIR